MPDLRKVIPGLALCCKGIYVFTLENATVHLFPCSILGWREIEDSGAFAPFEVFLSALRWALRVYCHSFISDTAPVYLSDLHVTLHQDSSAPPLTQELYAFRTWRPKQLYIAHFPMPLLLSGILCLVKLNIISQPQHFEQRLKTDLFKSYLC